MIKSPFDIDFQNKSIESKIVASLERISQAFRVLLWQESMQILFKPNTGTGIGFLITSQRRKKKSQLSR